MPTPIGFALVGCGMIARFHARALAEVPGAHVAGLVSRTPANAAALLAETGTPPCPVFATVEDAVRAPGVDVVVITTPSGAHLEPALTAAAAGKHVVVEKPLEITGPRCERIIAACDEHAVKLCTIFPSRFADANVALKAAVDAGKFGRLTLGEAANKWWRSQAYYDDGGWKGTQALDGGGALMNQAIHNVDLLHWLMGDVDTVQALTATLVHDRIEVEDTAVAALRFRNGALGVIEAATSAYPGLLKRTEIHGEHGSARVEQDDLTLWSFASEAPGDLEIQAALQGATGFTAGASDPRGISHIGHRDQLADFLHAIDTGGSPRVDGREGRKSVEIIRAIYRSSRTGSAVRLPIEEEGE